VDAYDPRNPGWPSGPSRINPGPANWQNQAGQIIPAMGVPPSNLPGLGNDPGQTINDPHHYANLIEGNQAVGQAAAADTQTPFLIMPSGRRNYLGIRNSSAAANIYIGFGNPASTASWLKLTAGQIVVWDSVVPQNDLYALADAAAGTISWAHSVIGNG